MSAPAVSAAHAALLTRGWHRFDSLVSQPAALQRALRDERTGGRVLCRPRCVDRAHRVFAESAQALALLDDAALGAVVGDLFGADATLSNAGGILADAPGPWSRPLATARAAVSSPGFLPGGLLLVATGGPAAVEVIETSQRVQSAQVAEHLPHVRPVLHPGDCLAVAAGTWYRLAEPADLVALVFVRPWMKPEIHLASALPPAVLARCGEQARRWCGVHLDVPTTVEAFLVIEEASLTAAAARSRGSGI